MSIEIAESFLRKISSDNELQIRCKQAASVAMVQVIRDAGYVFTQQEFQDAVSKMNLDGALEDEFLRGVSGGAPSDPGQVGGMNITDLMTGLSEEGKS